MRSIDPEYAGIVDELVGGLRSFGAKIPADELEAGARWMETTLWGMRDHLRTLIPQMGNATARIMFQRLIADATLAKLPVKARNLVQELSMVALAEVDNELQLHSPAN